MTKRNRKAWSIRPLGLALTLIACGVFAGAATAAPIVTWDLANATGQDAAVLATALNVSATSIDEVGATEWASTAQDGFIAASGWTSNASPDSGQYYEWSITADVGYGVTYDSFDVSLFRGSGAVATAPISGSSTPASTPSRPSTWISAASTSRPAPPTSRRPSWATTSRRSGCAAER